MPLCQAGSSAVRVRYRHRRVTAGLGVLDHREGRIRPVVIAIAALAEWRKPGPRPRLTPRLLILLPFGAFGAFGTLRAYRVEGERRSLRALPGVQQGVEVIECPPPLFQGQCGARLDRPAQRV